MHLALRLPRRHLLPFSLLALSLLVPVTPARSQGKNQPREEDAKVVLPRSGREKLERFFKDREIAVVGGGDSAIEEAIFLTKFADKVTVIHRRDTLRASKIMQDRAFANPKIEFLWNHTVTDLVGTDTLEAARVRSVVTGDETLLPVSGLFVAIGHRPNTDLFLGQLDLDENGYLLTGRDGMAQATNVDGVFACGDVQDHTYRQAITASGTGCAAALDAERFIASFVEL